MTPPCHCSSLIDGERVFKIPSATFHLESAYRLCRSRSVGVVSDQRDSRVFFQDMSLRSIAHLGIVWSDSLYGFGQGIQGGYQALRGPPGVLGQGWLSVFALIFLLSRGYCNTQNIPQRVSRDILIARGSGPRRSTIPYCPLWTHLVWTLLEEVYPTKLQLSRHTSESSSILVSTQTLHIFW